MIVGWMEEEEEDMSDNKGVNNVDSIVEMEEGMKMVIVMRSDLKMKSGKMCAQTGHAVLGAYRQIMGERENGIVDSHRKVQQHYVSRWEQQGQMKIVLQADSQQQLQLIHS